MPIFSPRTRRTGQYTSFECSLVPKSGTFPFSFVKSVYVYVLLKEDILEIECLARISIMPPSIFLLSTLSVFPNPFIIEVPQWAISSSFERHASFANCSNPSQGDSSRTRLNVCSASSREPQQIESVAIARKEPRVSSERFIVLPGRGSAVRFRTDFDGKARTNEAASARSFPSSIIVDLKKCQNAHGSPRRLWNSTRFPPVGFWKIWT
mmetsp:Transcript_1423/g.1958  ORF Transcript_1423/g.1958 Transcript_1423/m.1958 type:complete len:209 (-) Transcript_1423:585-1211(-)